MSNTQIADLISAFPTWDALKTHLTSEAGGKLSVYEVPNTNLAVVRYVKGQSNMTMEHVGAFRSVVWNMGLNRPVSITAPKSEVGECFPTLGPDSDILLEEFVDGVMIGQFWDADSESWRIHTRSTLDAKCRYYSKRSFSELFQEAAVATYGVDAPLTDRLEKGVSYTWVLQHPENRIVCPVSTPRLVMVAAHRIQSDGTFEPVAAPEGIVTPKVYFTKTADATVGRMDTVSMLRVIGVGAGADAGASASTSAIHVTHAAATGFVPVDLPSVIGMVANMRGSIQYQGVVIKDATQPFKRWKIRSQIYNQVRKLRGNTARRDFLWMDLWSKGGLEEYLKHFPEERTATLDLIQRWKTITQTVFKTYVDAFKARSLDRSQIPAKIRPLVYGLHTLYMTVLRPAHRGLDWRETVRWMNDRDTAQKIFVLNWDLRQDISAVLPFEPAATAALRIVEAAAPAAAPAAAETSDATA